MLLGQTLRMRKHRLRTGRIDQGHLKQHINGHARILSAAYFG